MLATAAVLAVLVFAVLVLRRSGPLALAFAVLTTAFTPVPARAAAPASAELACGELSTAAADLALDASPAIFGESLLGALPPRLSETERSGGAITQRALEPVALLELAHACLWLGYLLIAGCALNLLGSAVLRGTRAAPARGSHLLPSAGIASASAGPAGHWGPLPRAMHVGCTERAGVAGKAHCVAGLAIAAAPGVGVVSWVGFRGPGARQRDLFGRALPASGTGPAASRLPERADLPANAAVGGQARAGGASRAAHACATGTACRSRAGDRGV